MTKTSPQETRKINYLYFGIYFSLLALCSASSIFTKEDLAGSRIFFFLYSLGQGALETSLLVIVGFFLRRYVHSFLFFSFIGCTFSLLILHFLDFILERILNLSVWASISSFVLGESLDNFLYLLDAAGVPLWIWGILFSFMALIPFIGIYLYKATEKLVKKSPFSLKIEPVMVGSLCLGLSLFLWDFSASPMIHPNTYSAFLQSLPWKNTFLMPKSIAIQTSGPLFSLPEEKKMIESFQEITPLNHKPNIYLFVIESLRRDLLSEETAPHLFSFFKK